MEALSQKHSEKIRFYLSKADEAGHESDRQRVMMQIVQELCKRPGLNRTGFDMPTIYIPNPNKTVRCVNQIDDVCRDVEKTINQTIQNTLNQLERDCDQIGKQVDHVIAVDNASRSHNNWAMSKGVLSGLMGLLAIATLVVNFLTSSLSDKLIKDVLGRDGYTYLTIYLVQLFNIILKKILHWESLKCPRKK